MDEKTRALIKHMRTLHWQLFELQGEEIAALRRAIDVMQRSHDIVGRLIVADTDADPEDHQA